MKLEHTSRSCDVTTPRTNLRSQSVTMAKMLRLRKSASSASGVDGVMIVYGVAAVRLNLDMYFSTLSSYRVVVRFGETREKGNQPQARKAGCMGRDVRSKHRDLV